VLAPRRIEVGQVRDGDQLQLGIEDAEQLVTREIQPGQVALDMLVLRRIAEAQVAVALGQRQDADRSARHDRRPACGSGRGRGQDVRFRSCHGL